jgi:hypothetical protein
MVNKQTLRVESSQQGNIVSIGKALSSYIDEAYYKEYMFENVNDPNFKSYPVKVVALRMQWILKNTGQRFLQGILRSENLDLYTIPTVQIMIEFLYKPYKENILKLRLPVYIFELIIFFVTIYLNEGKFEEATVMRDGVEFLTLNRKPDHGSFYIIISAVCNLFVAFFVMYQQE